MVKTTEARDRETHEFSNELRARFRATGSPNMVAGPELVCSDYWNARRLANLGIPTVYNPEC